MIKEYIINRDNKIALQPACSDVFSLGGGYKQHLHWVLPMSGFNNVLSIFAQSQGLVADTHKRCNELHPTKLEGMQTISPSPLHRERIECPATKGAEDILGEGLFRREEEVQAFHFNLGIPNTIYREECKKC